MQKPSRPGGMWEHRDGGIDSALLEAECDPAGGEELLGLGFRGPSHSHGFYQKEPTKFSLRREEKSPHVSNRRNRRVVLLEYAQSFLHDKVLGEGGQARNRGELPQLIKEHLSKSHS